MPSTSSEPVSGEDLSEALKVDRTKSNTPSSTVITTTTTADSSCVTQSHNLNRNVSDSASSSASSSSSSAASSPNGEVIIQKHQATSAAVVVTDQLNSNSQNSIDESSLSSLNESSTSLAIIPNDELELLVRLERANKEMETNNRSAQSILQATTTTTTNGTNSCLNSNRSPSTSHSLSRRASVTSDVNSISAEDAISKLDEISWELWNQIITEWNVWSKKKPGQLKEYIRKGIPVYLRPLAWQYLCGANATDSREKYKEYIKRQSSCEKIIRRDVDRTYPDNEFFRNPAGQESLFNVMKAYSIHDPEVGYCQGSAFICGLLLIQSIPEEEAFAIFVQIMHQYNLREIYKPNMYHLGLCMFQLDAMLQESIPDLHKHFAAHAFYPSMYSSSWFLTLFTTALPLTLVCRVFDIFLNEGFEIVFRIGLAILECHKDNLMTMDMEGMIKYFQKELPTKHETDHDGFLNKAFAVKYNARKMKKLEKDFTVIKKEEQEEQVEIRRLRAENKLLKQRIENLEKESASLADRLIKGQVVNAQSAESIYILKNENQKLKDKIADLQSQYEQEVEQRRRQTSEQDNTSNEREILHEKVNMLLEENTKLRETPDNQRFEEELVQVKLREAEAQLAIKDLQKTLHVLNLEYQQFLNNRGAVLLSLNAPPISTNSSGSGSSPTPSINGLNRSDFEALEEELLKVKMREAEEVSELKAVNLKLMQLETEKQVAYKQIKRQDEEIRRLNQTIYAMKEKELDTKSQLMESRRQVDDKEALLKELNMTHKLQEAEDAHVIAELRQRVAALEVQIQEVVTQGQLNYNNQKIISSATSQYDLDHHHHHHQSVSSSGSGVTSVNGRMNQRTTSSAELTEDMKYMMLMSSTGSLLLDGPVNKNINKRANSMADEETISSPTTPTTPSVFSSAKITSNGVASSSSHNHVKNFLSRSQSDEPTTKSLASPVFKESVDSAFVINEEQQTAINEADQQQQLIVDETTAVVAN